MISIHQGSSLFYHKTGHGRKILLLFHGFGQDHTAFVPLAENLKDQYTCYIFDLYFHGDSQWNNDERPLEKSEWKEILQHFMDEHRIDSFSVAGFSLGGKLALATVEAFSEKISSIVLIAPDGIKTSFWYSLATYPFAFRSIFRSIIYHPEIFTSLIRFFQSTGLMDRGLLRFAESQMNTEAKRKKVYYSWVVLRHLTFDMKKIASVINKQNINTIFIAGKYDKVIKAENLSRLSRHLNTHKTLIVESGHSHLVQHPEVINAMKA
jgi:pimeloyl-ACP methyl ester carboxylesterase